MTTRESLGEFEILIEPDEDGFHVWCPALKGCHSFGMTKEEARENIREAIELWLEDASDSPIPDRERITVRLP
ncbi:MAG: type II toxin-antitoxin system HicB family antitoxin [Dehalococcoidia bacterium]